MAIASALTMFDNSLAPHLVRCAPARLGRMPRRRHPVRRARTPRNPGGRLLPRVILPRAGEPLDVRTLYLEESNDERQSRALAVADLAGGRRGIGGVLRDLLQRVPGQLLAAVVDPWTPWCCVPSSPGTRVDVYRSKADRRANPGGGPAIDSGESGDRPRLEFEIKLDPFEDGGWIWFDITTDRRSCCTAPAGTPRSPPPGGPLSPSASPPSTGRPTASRRWRR